MNLHWNSGIAILFMERCNYGDWFPFLGWLFFFCTERENNNNNSSPKLLTNLHSSKLSKLVWLVRWLLSSSSRTPPLSGLRIFEIIYKICRFENLYLPNLINILKVHAIDWFCLLAGDPLIMCQVESLLFFVVGLFTSVPAIVCAW